MPLPEPTGPFRVGVIEADIPSPETPAKIVPVVIYYPAAPEEPAEEPSSFFGSAAASPAALPWLNAQYAGALGRCHLTDVLGAYAGEVLMNGLGPAATGYEVVRGAVGAPAVAAADGGSWPCAVFSHSMTGWRHVNSAFMSEVASRGAVAIHLEHCDESACLATSVADGRVLAEYVSWQAKEAELRAAHGSEGFMAEALRWRHAQVEIRVRETHAALDGVEGALRDAGVLPPAPAGRFVPFARTGAGVAVMGQSFGGASAAACVCRDAERGRFSHCLMYDPWIDGAGDDRHPLAQADYDRPFHEDLRKLAVWRNGQSPLKHTCSDNCDAIVRKAGARGELHDEGDAAHFAQTDAPVIFELGPLNFVYAALKGGEQSGADSQTLLRKCTEETVAALAGFFLPSA